jgi:FkbM family methyltransferase
MTRLLQYSFRELKRGPWLLRSMLGLRARTEAEAWFHLAIGLARGPRHIPGQFALPFGTVEYVDGRSFAYQFEDIFVRHIYDFESDRPNPLILDCGGNVGLSPIWFKRRYPSSRVVVFEADPEIAAVMERNLKAFHLDDVEVVKAAVWSASGRVRFARDGADGGRIGSEAAEEVPAVRLADRITGTVDLLKMDIEGAEFEVLADLCQTGKIRHVRRLICEAHSRDGNAGTVRAMLDGLAQNGFRVCFNHARPAPDLGGEPQPTPFPTVTDGKWLLEFYAWQP